MPVYNDVCLQNMFSATQHFISKLVNLIFYTTSKLVNGFIEAAKRHALIKQTKDIYCPYCDCRNRIVCRDPNTIRLHLVRRGFMENYEIWDHHGERRTEAGNNEATDALEVREDGNAHLVMMHDDTGDDIAGGGGGDEGCGGEDDGEDNEEDFLEDMLRHVEQGLLLKGLNNLEMVQKEMKERLYEEEKGCVKRLSLLRFVQDILILKAKYGWSDRSFIDLLTLLADVLPKPNFVLSNTYQAKKLISPLTMGVE